MKPKAIFIIALALSIIGGLIIYFGLSEFFWDASLETIVMTGAALLIISAIFNTVAFVIGGINVYTNHKIKVWWVFSLLLLITYAFLIGQYLN